MGPKSRRIGATTVDFRFGKTYPHPAIIADVLEAIIGWDMLAHYKLDVCWQGKTNSQLVDSARNRWYRLKMGAASARI